MHRLTLNGRTKEKKAVKLESAVNAIDCPRPLAQLSATSMMASAVMTVTYLRL